MTCGVRLRHRVRLNFILFFKLGRRDRRWSCWAGGGVGSHSAALGLFLECGSVDVAASSECVVVVAAVVVVVPAAVAFAIVGTVVGLVAFAIVVMVASVGGCSW